MSAPVTALSHMQTDAELIDVLLDYDALTGLLHWKQNRRGGARAGEVAGTRTARGSIQIHCKGKIYHAHRIAWRLAMGRWPTGVIDHINGDPSDNRLVNLRDVSQGTNQENQRRAHISNKSSGLLGVSFDARTGRWLAKISVSNRTKNLGRYASPDQAHEAYFTAKRELHQGATI